MDFAEDSGFPILLSVLLLFAVPLISKSWGVLLITRGHLAMSGHTLGYHGR